MENKDVKIKVVVGGKTFDIAINGDRLEQLNPTESDIAETVMEYFPNLTAFDVSVNGKNYGSDKLEK